MSEKALEGVKVADFSWMAAGPQTIRYLAFLGAQVVRVESKTRVDPARTFGPFRDDILGLDRSVLTATGHTNKYGITLNLRHPGGVEVAKRLVAWADIAAENFAPGTMEGFGLGYEELRQVKPDIIMISLSNLGQTGPLASRPGAGAQLQALSGFTDIIGWPDRTPAGPYFAYTDYIAPYFGAVALLAALDYRRQTGRGMYFDLSQFETGLHFLAPALLDYSANGREAQRMGNRCPYAAPHGAYRCRGDDRWCAIGVFTDGEWRAFCRVIGNPPWTEAPRFSTLMARLENVDEMDRLVGEWTAGHSAEEVMALMQEAGVAAGVVQNAQDLAQDVQLRHRQFYRHIDNHREIGSYEYLDLPFTLSHPPPLEGRSAPCLGEHNEFVCREFLGMSDDEFVRLIQEGAFE